MGLELTMTHTQLTLKHLPLMIVTVMTSVVQTLTSMVEETYSDWQTKRKWESSHCLDGRSKKAKASQLMHAENVRKTRSDGSGQTGAKMWHLLTCSVRVVSLFCPNELTWPNCFLANHKIWSCLLCTHIHNTPHMLGTVTYITRVRTQA